MFYNKCTAKYLLKLNVPILAHTGPQVLIFIGQNMLTIYIMKQFSYSTNKIITCAIRISSNLSSKHFAKCSRKFDCINSNI